MGFDRFGGPPILLGEPVDTEVEVELGRRDRAVAGLGLTAFGAGLLSMYFGGDQYTEDDGIRPSSAGLAIAKDSWLVGIGLALAALPRK